MREKFLALLNISVQPGDSDETRESKALSIALAVGMSLGGIIWGIYCLIGSEPGAAIIPFAYTLLTFFNILYLRASGNDHRFRSIQIFLSLMLPFLLMVALGGFRVSGAVVIWSLVAPLGATLFTGRREAITWFIAFILLVLFSGLIEPIIAHQNNFSATLITIFYVMNVLAPTSLAIILLFYFLQQRHQALELMKEAQAEAEAANQAKSTFLANMSHELRSPMNAILGFTQVMLRAKDLKPTQIENLEVIMRSGTHLLTLINQVLDLSKVEAGRMELVETTVDLPGMLDELEDMFSLQATNKNLQLSFERDSEIPQFIQLDELKLKQVLINLLNNALKFTEQGSVTLRIQATDVHDKNNQPETSEVYRLFFIIEDTGPGIAEEELDAVFAAFSQTETGMKSGGAGLGLPISRQLVQLMGGDMQVTSNVDIGTKFSFHILAKIVTGISKAEISDTDGKTVAGLLPGQPEYRILIVDDEWENREALYRLLGPLGFDLRQAENGQEAVEISEKWQPHLIWMDIRMPVMNGFKASTAIRSLDLEPEPAIIALTASTYMDENDQALEAGCHTVIRKPYREEDIFAAMEQYLGVQYQYESPQEHHETKHDSPVTASRLAAIPADIKKQLSEALIVLDTDQMDHLVEKIQMQDEILANGIRDLLDRYEYEQIHGLLEETEKIK